LIFFYVHFAVAFLMARLPVSQAPVVWLLLAVGATVATWLVATAAAPLTRYFQSPAAWGGPLVLIAVAAAWPGLPPAAAVLLAGAAGLIFAAYHPTLAYLIINRRPLGTTTPGSAHAIAGGFVAGVLRVALVAALLVSPELVRWVETAGSTRPVPKPPQLRNHAAATPSDAPGSEAAPRPIEPPGSPAPGAGR
jgi:hypothetical protein